jgi:hypothetical protein
MTNSIFVIVPFAVMHVLDSVGEIGCECAHYVACILDMIGCSWY